jgi:hypothetical protein
MNIFGYGTDHVIGLFTVNQKGQVTVVATINNKGCVDGQTASGQGCAAEDYNQGLVINSAGTVAATSNVWGNKDGDAGVSLNGDTVNGRVAWPGQNINGCLVQQAYAGGINSAGHIALLLDCLTTNPNTQPAEEVVLATPTTN